MRAGRMRDRVTFERRVEGSDGQGNVITGGWEAVLSAEPCEYMIDRGREMVRGGRVEGVNMAVIAVRSHSGTQAVTRQMRAVIDGEAHQIRSITNADRRGHVLEIVLERGVAV